MTTPAAYAEAMHELVTHHSRQLAAILSTTHTPVIQTDYSAALDLPLTYTFRSLFASPHPAVIARYTPSDTALDVAVEYLAPTLYFISPALLRDHQYARNTDLHRVLQRHGYSTPPIDTEWDPFLRIHHSRVFTHSVSTHRSATSITRVSHTSPTTTTSLDYLVTLKERLF